MSTKKIDPVKLKPGLVLQHRDGGTVALAYRKDGGTGWWCSDGSGLADSVIAGGDWQLVCCPMCGRPARTG